MLEDSSYFKGAERARLKIAVSLRKFMADLVQSDSRMQGNIAQEREKGRKIMEETFERVIERHAKAQVPVKHLYRRQYQTAGGNWQTIYYGIFTDWKGIRRKVTLGNDLRAAKDGLAIQLADNIKRVDFDAERQKARQQGMTIAKWSESYLQLEQVRKQRALNRTREFIAVIKRHLGDLLLTEIQREHLFGYWNERQQEHIIRAGKPREKNVSLGTIANELSCLGAKLNKARECDIQAATPSFKGLIQRGQRDRVLSADEESAMLETYPAWLQRIAIVARETCLSKGISFG
jgi:hypothetical protein